MAGSEKSIELNVCDAADSRIFQQSLAYQQSTQNRHYNFEKNYFEIHLYFAVRKLFRVLLFYSHISVRRGHSHQVSFTESML